MGWGKKQIEGALYDLSHLDPFVMEVKAKAADAPTYRVQVSFGCHTFTRELVDGDTPDLHFLSNGELRCFCIDRHRLSLELPEMIRYASGGRVYFSERSNFLVVESIPEKNAPYVAFFNLEKAKKLDGHDLAMFVTSAYVKPGLPGRLPAVTFSTLVDYRYQGKTLQRPPPRRVLPVRRKIAPTGAISDG